MGEGRKGQQGAFWGEGHFSDTGALYHMVRITIGSVPLHSTVESRGTLDGAEGPREASDPYLGVWTSSWGQGACCNVRITTKTVFAPVCAWIQMSCYSIYTRYNLVTLVLGSSMDYGQYIHLQGADPFFVLSYLSCWKMDHLVFPGTGGDTK